MKHSAVILLFGFLGCISPNQGPAHFAPPSPQLDTEKEAVAKLLNAFHDAASKADGDRYFNYFAPEGVFIGTDATERWTLEQFRTFCEPYFSKGKGWTYIPTERHVMVSSDGTTAWFDERLHNEKYGATRGSGVLIKSTGQWKLAHYVLSFPIPNDVANKVVNIVQSPDARATQPTSDNEPTSEP